MWNEHSDPDFEAKLPLYKTAFSWQHGNYVRIKNVVALDNGIYMLECEVVGKEGIFKFSPRELSNFVM